MGLGNQRAKGKPCSLAYANCFAISNKISYLNYLASFYSFDVIALTETKLNDTFPDAILSLDNMFTVFRKDRTRHGGGVALLISKSVRCSLITIPEALSAVEIIAVDVFINGKSTRIISCYHANHSSDIGPIIEALEFLLSTHKQTIITGDFNMPHIDWSSMTASDSKCNEFLSFVLRNGLCQHVHSPTRLNPDHILDLLLTNTPSVREVVVGELFSDHKLIRATLNLSLKKLPNHKTLLNFRKADYDSINFVLSNTNWNSIFRELSVEEMYSQLLEIATNLINTYVPTVTRNFLLKKYPAEVRRLQKLKLYIWRNEGNTERYKAISALLKKSLTDYDTSELEKKLTTGSSKTFFRFMKDHMKPFHEVGIIKNNGEIICDDITKAELFADRFSEVFTHDDGNVPFFKPRSNSIIDGYEFEPYIVEAVLAKLKPRHNRTPDQIPAIFLKRVATAIAFPLTLIYNKSLSTGNIPHIWKKAIVVPLHKKGLRSDCNNYRPIALTSSVCKTMETILRRVLVQHLNVNGLLNGSQYGFRAYRSCESQLIHYQGSLLQDLERHKANFAIYIDFSKAFDKVPHNKLLTKLEGYGVQGNLLRWLSTFLTNRNQVISLNGIYSKPMDVISGVPQGSVLGPLLFLLYINDISDNVESNILMFADDLKLFSPHSNLLQNDLATISDWCSQWQMTVAPNKCEVIAFRLSTRNLKSKTSPDFHISGLKLPFVRHIRDLGIFFSDDLSFTHHVNIILRRSQFRVNMLFNILKNSTMEVFIRCYIIYIRPILEYGCTIFSPYLKLHIRKIESIQKSFVHRIFKKFGIEYTSYFNALDICGLDSLELRRLVFDLVFIYKSIISREIYCANALFTFIPSVKSLRRHPFYLRCNIKNSNKSSSQFLSNRTLNCWNSLPVSSFPVKSSSRSFKTNLKHVDLSKYLTLSPLNY